MVSYRMCADGSGILPNFPGLLRSSDGLLPPGTFVSNKN